MPVENHALIVGAGVAGPACALSLREAGYSVSLIEAYPGRAEVGAALMIAPNGLAMLDRLGLADRVAAAGTPIDRYSFLSQGGRRVATLRLAPRGRYRYPAVSLSRATLYGIMLDAVAERGVTVGYGKRLVGVEQDANGVTARLADRQELRAAILIGADGIRSSVRRLAFGEAPEPQFTGQIGGGGFVPRSAMSRLLGPGEEGVMTFAAGDRAFFGCAFGDRQEERGAYWWYSLPRERPIDDAARQALAGERGAEAVLKAGDGWSKLVRDIIGATTNLSRRSTSSMWRRCRGGATGEWRWSATQHTPSRRTQARAPRWPSKTPLSWPPGSRPMPAIPPPPSSPMKTFGGRALSAWSRWDVASASGRPRVGWPRACRPCSCPCS